VPACKWAKSAVKTAQAGFFRPAFRWFFGTWLVYGQPERPNPSHTAQLLIVVVRFVVIVVDFWHTT